MIYLNLADDYFKALQEAKMLRPRGTTWKGRYTV